MNKGSNFSKANLDKANQIEIRPNVVNAWLDKNKSALSKKKEKINTISDCPAPWG